MEQIESYAERAQPAFAARLNARLKELLGDLPLDPARLAPEAAFLAERADVSEEIVRLGSHLDALAGLVKETAPVGKRIEFLLQEITRELNTIGDDVSVGTLSVIEHHVDIGNRVRIHSQVFVPGLVANVIASYFVSKFLFEWVLGKSQVETLSI